MASAADAQVGLLGGQVDGRQLVQAHHVVGDDDLDGRLGDPPPGIVHGGLDVGDGIACSSAAATSRSSSPPPAPERRIRRSRLLP